MWFLRQKHKNTKQKHEMCKTNVKMNIYFINICKYEYEKNMTMLRYKIMLKIGVEQIERKEGFYFYVYPFEDIA